MSLFLPPVSLTRISSQHEDGWSGNYGAPEIAARYAGFALSAPFFIKAIWQHGCFGPWEACTPGALVFNAPRAQGMRCFVARQEEEDYLKANGYSKARAIGLPIIYAPELGKPRIPGSLLVMPTHSLMGDRYPDKKAFRKYANEIREAAKGVSKTYVCIHPSCKKNGLWISEFSDLGFEIIDGALSTDLNALIRMRTLFEQVETMTTNGWGSHVAYALGFGAKVSIYGTKPDLRYENLLKDISWSVDERSLKLSLAETVRAEERGFLAKFLVHPSMAVSDEKLGNWLLGTKHKVSPVEMTSLLGELVDPVPRTHGGDGGARSPRILFVAPDASDSAQTLLLLRWLRQLRRRAPVEFDVFFADGGPRYMDFVKLACCFLPTTFPAERAKAGTYDAIYSWGPENVGLINRHFDRSIPVITHLTHSLASLKAYGPQSLCSILQQSSRFVLGSEKLAKAFSKDLGVEARNILILRGIPQHADWSKPDAGNEPSRVPPGTRVIIGQGGEGYGNGAELFLQLARRLSESQAGSYHFVWCGLARESQMRFQMEEDATSLGLSGMISWPDSEDDCVRWSDLAAAFCLCSRNDPAPWLLADWILSGLSGVGVRGSGAAAELADASNVPLFHPHDIPGICDALIGASSSARRNPRPLQTAPDQPDLEGAISAWLETVKDAVKAKGERPQIDDVMSDWKKGLFPPHPELEAQIARSVARKKARLLANEGKGKEAIQEFLKIIAEGLKSEHPRIALDTLCEVSMDVAKLDSNLSKHLAEEAKRFAIRSGMPLDNSLAQ